MSAFKKITGMFPGRPELGEAVAREILDEHIDELVKAAAEDIGPLAGEYDSMYVSRFVTGWYGALNFLEGGKGKS